MSKTALVLSGGGSRGAYQVGAWEGLVETGFRPDCVVGTSVGAINGALIASGCPVATMRKLWLSLSRKDIALARLDVWRFWKWRSLLRRDPLRRLLTAGVDFDAIHAGDLPLTITAVDVCCGEVTTFEHDEITVEHLLASAAVPGVFAPVTIEDHVYLDGAVVNNTPLRPAVRAGADRIVAILTDPAQPHHEPAPKNVVEVLMRVLDIHTHQAFAREFVKGQEINRLLDEGITWGDWHPISFHFVAPASPLGGNPLDFVPERTRRYLAQGVQDGRATAADMATT